ncbi:hypothetical protein, partial [Aeromonas sp. SE22]|uniref:hypothetical protein n=1 Tax=Aeromonas sp. SE22 TaxID=3135720 RepID=UPI00315FC6F7
RAHNPKVVGSNPAPATNFLSVFPFSAAFHHLHFSLSKYFTDIAQYHSCVVKMLFVLVFQGKTGRPACLLGMIRYLFTDEVHACDHSLYLSSSRYRLPGCHSRPGPRAGASYTDIADR